MKVTILAMILSLCCGVGQAKDKLDIIREILAEAPVQEKVYLHLDNNCYYRGEEIWYKAYVVRADDNQFTDMSRLLSRSRGSRSFRAEGKGRSGGFGEWDLSR